MKRDLSGFTLVREKDELKELASAMDELQTSLIERDANLSLSIDKVTQKIDSLTKLVERGTFEKKTFQEGLTEINILISELKKVR